MNKEEKQILLIDLSARYPYGVIIHSIWDYQELSGKIKRKETVRTMESHDFCDYWNCKPYLRPISSMTEKERQEYLAECDKDNEDSITTPRYHGIEWLNKKMFDYRGLIEKNLALDCTGLHIYD